MKSDWQTGQAGQNLERLLKTLATHSALISHAYFNGVIHENDQNKNSLAKLKELKILVPHNGSNGSGYRITGRFAQFIDGAMSSDRIRRFDTDLASWVDMLEQQISLYNDASQDNRMDDCDSYFSEIERMVFYLADTLDDHTRYLLMLVNSRFANVRTLAEKQKQNTFYISRLEKLVKATTALQPEILLELVEDHPLLYSLIDQHLIRLLPDYQRRLQDILDKLKIFLFELRKIEDRAQLIQGFAFFLQQNQTYQPKDWVDQESIPEHWNQIKPLSLFAYADPFDHAVEEDLIEISQKIQIRLDASDKDNLMVKPKKVLLNSVSLKTPHKQVLEMSAYRKQTARYFNYASNTPENKVSAMSFYKTCVTDIDPSIWLSCVLNEWLRRQQSNKKFQIELIQSTSDEKVVFSGNKKIQDILLILKNDKNISAHHE